MANAEKVAAVAELTQAFQASSGAVLTEYRGLTVAQLGELRQALGQHAKFTVVKNTLTKIAAAEAEVSSEFTDLLEGPSAIAFVSGDVVEAAKGLRDFAQANPLLVIKGGVLDGKKLGPAEIIKLADLESREVLLAKLAGAMKASLSGAAATFAALPTADGPPGVRAGGQAHGREPPRAEHCRRRERCRRRRARPRAGPPTKARAPRSSGRQTELSNNPRSRSLAGPREVAGIQEQTEEAPPWRR